VHPKSQEHSAALLPAVQQPVPEMGIPVSVPTPPPPPLHASRTAIMPSPSISTPPEQRVMPPPALTSAPAPLQEGEATIEPIFGIHEHPTLESILELVAEFDGVAGCAALLQRDLKFAGHIPGSFNAPTFRDTVWDTQQHAARFSRRTGLGSITVLTLQTDTGFTSLFTGGDAALCVFHSARELPDDVCKKLCALTGKMARML
jgi:hypothetical protein